MCGPDGLGELLKRLRFPTYLQILKKVNLHYRYSEWVDPKVIASVDIVDRHLSTSPCSVTDKVGNLGD